MDENMKQLSSLFSSEILASLLQIQKGRILIYRILKFASGSEYGYSFLKLLFDFIPKFLQKFPDDEVFGINY